MIATRAEEESGSREQENGEVLEVAGRLHSTAIHVLRHVRVEDPKTGLTPARLSALSVVVFGGERSLGELAEAEQVTSATMSRLVSALVDEGLVVRERNPDDGRSVLLRATPEGRRVLEDGRDRRIGRLGEVLRLLDREDLRAVERACSALERALSAD